MDMATRLDRVEERQNKVFKVLFGSDETGETGLQADYIVSKRLFKIVMWVIGILNGIVITLASISIKYGLDLLADVARLKTILEMHIK
jgi:hypothetical protein